MKTKKLLIGGIALAVIVVIILWLTVFGKSAKPEQALYKTEAVSRGEIEALVIASGTLNPVDAIDVGTQVSGRIAKIYVDFNSKVKAGQLVAELDQATYEARLEQNKANYKTALAAQDRANVTLDSTKRAYDRALSLFEKNLISFEEKDTAETTYLNSKSDVKSAEARVDQAKSQVDSSQVDLNYCIIRSPIDGVVISRNVNVGQTVASQFTAPVLFKVANDLTKMQVECSIDEADIGRVKEGQRVRFSVDAYANDTFVGDVTQVRYSPTVTSNVVTYTAIVTVSNPELKLRPGMTATASIITGQAQNALKVPNSSLRFTPNLTAEEMQKIMKSTFEAMRSKTGGAADAQSKQSGGQGQPAGQAPHAQIPQGGGSPTPSGAGTMSAAQGSGQTQPGARRQMARVWIQDEKGELKPVFLRTGVSDNSSTEVLWGDLKEGQLVITGSNAGSQQFGPPSAMRMLTGR
jgi:HlyD family secretion protein